MRARRLILPSPPAHICFSLSLVPPRRRRRFSIQRRRGLENDWQKNKGRERERQRRDRHESEQASFLQKEEDFLHTCMREGSRRTGLHACLPAATLSLDCVRGAHCAVTSGYAVYMQRRALFNRQFFPLSLFFVPNDVPTVQTSVPAHKVCGERRK